ncbi:LysR family transcriptional regulator [Litoreibacter roseus]|uniref:Transcriptional regulator n=1 Tax=Litoreibacter roseus TaxID=2601869 RepID=A0A6N6JJ92_9RHOB|nr:LysR family transcriptional regulator [Litoreibacter roseus]GFE66346.1 transcriptional regulator [Litoreibacter roseus]
MGETKENWDDLRLFVAVARGHGLAKASLATGKSPPTLSRRMLDLEKSIGHDLFRRLPKGYELTEDGQALFEKVTRLEADLLTIWKPPARGKRTLVKISAGTWMSKFLCENMTAIVGPEEAVLIRLISAEEVLDIGRREAVIGIRNQRPHQRGLAGRRVGRVRFAAYARNESVSAWARFTGSTPSADWLKGHVGDSDCIEVTSPRNALDLAVAGAARVVLPTFVGDAQAGLMRVSQTIDALEGEQWLVVHDDDRFSPEVRRTVDRLYKVLQSMHREHS